MNLEKKLFVILAFVLIVLLTLGFSVIMVYGETVNLGPGECYYVNENVSVCAKLVSVNVTELVIQNTTFCPEWNDTVDITCPQYNFSPLVDSVEFVRNDIINATDDLELVSGNVSGELLEIVSTFNLTEKYSDMKVNWNTCSEEIQYYINETERLSPYEDKFNICNSERSRLQSDYGDCKEKYNECDSNKWFFGFGGLFLGIIGFAMWNKISTPDRTEYDAPKGEPLRIDEGRLDSQLKGAFNKLKGKRKGG